jgi:hypothetical protein
MERYLPPAKFDVFVSYRHREPDASCVRDRLVPELRRYEVKVCLDVEAFLPGPSLMSQMEQAVLTSRYTLMVLSPAYLEGRFARAETVMAARLGSDEAQRRLMAIVLAPCDDGGLRARTRFCVDLTAEPDCAEAVRRLVEEIRRAV